MIITIDGPSAAGKGTLASALAEKHHFAYFDTGLTYRAVGLELYLQGFDGNNEAKAIEIASSLTFPQMMKLSLHKDFRSDIGGRMATSVARFPKVREYLTKMMRDFALNPFFADGLPAQGVIYDGRDTGTIVCPEANIKFYLYAAPEVRAERRLKDFQRKGLDMTFEQVLEHTKTRDASDATVKGNDPAPDAVIIDASDLSIDEVIKKAEEIIESKQKLLEK